MRSVGRPLLHRAAQQLVLARLDALDTDPLLEVHRERGLHRLQHAGGAGFLALFDVRNEVLVVRTDVIDGAAARNARR